MKVALKINLEFSSPKQLLRLYDSPLSLFGRIIYLNLFLLFFSPQLYAHESRPLFIQITEKSHSFFELKLNIPNSVKPNNLPGIIFLDDVFRDISSKIIDHQKDGILISQTFKIADSVSLKGQSFGIHFPRFNPVITSLVQINLLDKTSNTLLVPPEKNQFQVPEDLSKLEVFQQYTQLGIEHIWAGIDHLLFVLCLIFITGFGRKLFITITGFTLAHSLTLGLSALDLIRVSSKPVEACIALSILFLCHEITQSHFSKKTLTYQKPLLISSVFGLLHGLGFASVLSEIGLPQSEKISALLFFNIGVEIGQVLFIGALFLVFFAYQKTPNKNANFEKVTFKIGVYFIGIISAYWLFERVFV